MNPSLHQASFITGSPKTTGSASRRIAQELANRLEEFGVRCSFHSAIGAFRGGPGWSTLQADMRLSDLLVFASPIYFDALPYPLTALLERLAADADTRPPRLVAIATCGFAEGEHTQVGLDIARLFARRTGRAWLGGLGVPGAGAIGDAPLEAHRGKTANLREALDLCAGALARGEALPQVARELAGRPPLPPAVYRWAGAAGWVAEGLRQGAATKLWSQPFRR